MSSDRVATGHGGDQEDLSVWAKTGLASELNMRLDRC